MQKLVNIFVHTANQWTYYETVGRYSHEKHFNKNLPANHLLWNLRGQNSLLSF